MRRLVTTLCSLLLVALAISANEPIMGVDRINADAMSRFVQQYNRDFDPAVAEAYIEEGRRLGVRGDVAFCQAIIETGWFRFTGGTAVTPDQHNYCGLGVTRLGVKGHSFATIAEGVRAQLQHLFAYATRRPLPKGEVVVDPRFRNVRRGCAPTWQALSGRWAMNAAYGRNILNLYESLCQFAQLPALETIEIDIPDEN